MKVSGVSLRGLTHLGANTDINLPPEQASNLIPERETVREREMEADSAPCPQRWISLPYQPPYTVHSLRPALDALGGCLSKLGNNE